MFIKERWSWDLRMDDLDQDCFLPQTSGALFKPEPCVKMDLVGGGSLGLLVLPNMVILKNPPFSGFHHCIFLSSYL